VKINFYATLRAVVGGKTLQVTVPPPCTVRAALLAATEAKPELGAELWKAPGQLQDHIHVLLNGRNIRHLPQGIETPLRAEDALDIFPPVGGG
jgi:MoaD family protein